MFCYNWSSEVINSEVICGFNFSLLLLDLDGKYMTSFKAVVLNLCRYTSIH